VREHLGGIYDYLRARDINNLNELSAMNSQSAASTTASTQTNDDTITNSGKISYAEHKEQQKKIRRVEKLIKESETKIEAMEKRIAEIDTLLCLPENAADMTLINEYTEIKSRMDEEEERWTELSEELEALK
jgi:ATP-binding cassette subfamily F protein 3